MTERFEELITTRERIRELYGAPGRGSASKVIDILADTLERDIGEMFGRNEDIEFLSKIERVATLQLVEK